MPRRALAISLALAASTGPLAAQPPGKSPPLDTLLARARADSNDPMAHYTLAIGYWRKKRFGQADEALRLALRLAPQYAEAHLARAAVAEARGQRYWEKLTKDLGADSAHVLMREQFRGFQVAFLLNPLVDPGLLPKMSEDAAFFIGPIAIPIRWQVEVARAVNGMRKGEYATARERLDKLVAQTQLAGPGAAPADVYWYRALAAAHLGDFAAASDDFWTLVRKALLMEQKDWVAHLTIPTNHYRYMLASMLYLGGRYNDALAMYRRTLEHDAGLYMSHVQMARIFESAGEWDQAIAARQAARAANPDDAGLVLDLAGTLVGAGRPGEALDLLSEAESLAPRDPRVPYLRGVLGEARGDTVQAARAYRRFLELAPSRYAEQRAEAAAFLDRGAGGSVTAP